MFRLTGCPAVGMWAAAWPPVGSREVRQAPPIHVAGPWLGCGICCAKGYVRCCDIFCASPRGELYPQLALGLPVLLSGGEDVPQAPLCGRFTSIGSTTRRNSVHNSSGTRRSTRSALPLA